MEDFTEDFSSAFPLLPWCLWRKSRTQSNHGQAGGGPPLPRGPGPSGFAGEAVQDTKRGHVILTY